MIWFGENSVANSPTGVKDLITYPDKCVTNSLKGEAYDKVIVQVDDEELVASEIRNAISKAA